jgi:beta-galactosidase
MADSARLVVCLDGTWEVGVGRAYERAAAVPGLAGDPMVIDEAPIWYRTNVALPAGDWSCATLVLKGARFAPAVYVNGQELSRANGGMTWTHHLLRSPDVKPGNTVRLEVELASLKDVPPDDASCIPAADRWRTNVSSCLWDSVALRLHGDSRIRRIIPFVNLESVSATMRFEVEHLAGPASDAEITFELLDQAGKVLREASVEANDPRGEVTLDVGGLEVWCPPNPTCYRVRATLGRGGNVSDVDEFTLGLREFGTKDLKFRLNDAPCALRGGAVAWHRFTRDPEARELAWNAEWFEANVVKRLRGLGANAIRFQLGTPPESWLDVCDRNGIIVQAEWPFFHEVVASRDSLKEQWRAWLDLCARHPCVCLYHFWSEAPDAQAKLALEVIEELSAEYPKLTVSHRDVTHVHKYWWSLFENLGLYYDSAEQFDRPIMVDEFGGNYLDGQADVGGYKTLTGSFLRFLGRDHDEDARLRHQAESMERVAEYWRRLGAAGIVPTCVLGSPEDGNHWFLGDLTEGNPKPLWDSMGAAWGAASCSLDVWDRNFEPGKGVTFPVHFFNDADERQELRAKVNVGGWDGYGVFTNVVDLICPLGPGASMEQYVTLRTPPKEGIYRFVATLQSPARPEGEWPLMSSWRFRIHTVKPLKMAGFLGGVADEEAEIRQFLKDNGLGRRDLTSEDADVVIIGPNTWPQVLEDADLRKHMGRMIEQGKSVLMMDAGPQLLGPGYATGLVPPRGPARVEAPIVEEVELFRGVRLRFHEVAEPESCIHPPEVEDSLWDRVPPEGGCIWNGMRGGIVVPAVDMEVSGLSPESYLELWKGRGALPELIRSPHYYAFEFGGFYAFGVEDDPEVKRELAERVRLIRDDDASLRNIVDVEAPVRVIDLAEGYRQSLGGRATGFTPLAVAGKNLMRTPVVQIDFESGMGRLVISQLLMQGRIAKGFGTQGFYGVRYDPVAVQFALNLVRRAVHGR